MTLYTIVNNAKYAPDGKIKPVPRPSSRIMADYSKLEIAVKSIEEAEAWALKMNNITPDEQFAVAPISKLGELCYYVGKGYDAIFGWYLRLNEDQKSLLHAGATAGGVFITYGCGKGCLDSIADKDPIFATMFGFLALYSAVLTFRNLRTVFYYQERKNANRNTPDASDE